MNFERALEKMSTAPLGDLPKDQDGTHRGLQVIKGPDDVGMLDGPETWRDVLQRRDLQSL